MSLLCETGAIVPGADLNESGIYTITNTVNGKVYVGSAVMLRKRRDKHFRELREGKHHSIKLQLAWNKYGEGCFVFEPVLLCEKVDLIRFEQIEIDKRNAAIDGYNIHPVAGSRLGATLSAEGRKKVSDSKRGIKRKPFSPEWRAALSAAQKGNKNALGIKHTEQSKANMRKRVMPDSWRASLSMSLMGNTNCLGHKHSDESKAKISSALMGNTRRRGKTMSSEARAKISAATKGRPKTPEQRAKMSESGKIAWAKRRAA